MIRLIRNIIFIIIIIALISVFFTSYKAKITGFFPSIDTLVGLKDQNKSLDLSEENLQKTIVDNNDTIKKTELKEIAEDNKEKISTLKRIKNIIFKPKFNPVIIKAIIDLKSYSKDKDKLKIANKIIEINDFIESRDSILSRDSWQKILDCVYGKCEDELYLGLIDSIVLEDNDRQSNLIHSIIQSAIFWNTKNTIFFSETLTNANELIEDMNNERITKDWESIIECDGICDDFYDKVFAIIESISNI